jgi:surface carbohydrate biosynthesis protein
VKASEKVEDAVILVDSKVRDLDVAALIAHHLRGLGINCYLEPLEAFRAVLGAYRPGLIVFNHLTASHLVTWSQRLAEMGVLTAVLPNEGILYDRDVLRFNSGRYHNGAHIDYFYCWNEAHRDALLAEGFDKGTRVEVVGVPRFDFYFEPWSALVERPQPIVSSRPKILFCTNFVVADYWELPREEGDKLFALWLDRVPIYSNYWPAIEAHWNARRKVLEYLQALIEADRYEIILRPHPMENPTFYQKWIEGLSDAERAHLHFNRGSNISGLILDCDLEISCETCTTALESWIARKPTIELLFERHPLWYREIQAKANVPCDSPGQLPALIDAQLRNPVPIELQEARRRHLEEWCANLDGRSSLRVAEVIGTALRNKRPADWSKLNLNDYRRAFKLRTKKRMGVMYHFDPFLAVKRATFPRRYAVRDYTQEKSVTPYDVSEARKRLERLKT